MSIHLSKHNRLPVVAFVSLVLVLAIILSAGIALASGQADISLSEVYRILLYKVSNGLLGNTL